MTPNKRLLLAVRGGLPPDDQLIWRGRRAPQQKRESLDSCHIHHIMAENPSFLDSLRDFAVGATTLQAFNLWLVEVLVRGPSINRDEQGELEAHFPIEVDAAMYLDMVSDPDSPDFDELEARRLAGALCAILTQVPDPEDQAVLAHLARSARRSAHAIRQHLDGRLDRDGFERFLTRRPWPGALQAAVTAFGPSQLAQLADGLEKNDFAGIAAAFEAERDF